MVAKADNTPVGNRTTNTHYSNTSTSSSDDEDCPLCLNALTLADRLYPLHCPTVSCYFIFCGECLQKLCQAAADGYTLASDGSHQVKVALQCPQCRGPYNSKRTSSSSVKTTAQDGLKLAVSSSSSYSPVTLSSSSSATMVVTAVLKLRQAVSIPLPGSAGYLNDSECSATTLSTRRTFLQEVTVKELQDSVAILQEYNDSMDDDKHCGTAAMTVPNLDWDAWRSFLESYKSSSSPQNANISSVETIDAVLPRDPTLFLGLEDLLSLDEQEFITTMLVSGRAETIAQAAHLLQSIVELVTPQKSATGKNVARSSHSLPRQRAVATLTAAQREHQQKIRKRFPLPLHMPRAVMLPAYNPLDVSKAPLKFVDATKANAASTSKDSKSDVKPANTATAELTLASVRGTAGPVGLRKGDVVTHVMGERVATWSEFTIALQHQLDKRNADSTTAASGLVQITVNANEETARLLQVRAQEMKQQGVRFHA
jgi:hypothetical protein